MLKNKEILISIMVWMFSSSSWAQLQEPAALEEPHKNHAREIVTIVDGKQYAAFEDYKMEKLRNSIKKKLMADSVQIKNISPSQWVRSLSPNLLIDLTEVQIRGLIQEVALFQMSKTRGLEKSSEMEQMQAMLNEFYSNNDGKPSVNLDESKIKTIYIPTR